MSSANIVEPLMAPGPQVRAAVRTFFLFIIAATCAAAPGFAPDEQLQITFALGVTSLVAYTYYASPARARLPQAFRRADLVAAFLMVPLEIIDNLVRPVSLSLRLFAT